MSVDPARRAYGLRCSRMEHGKVVETVDVGPFFAVRFGRQGVQARKFVGALPRSWYQPVFSHDPVLYLPFAGLDLAGDARGRGFHFVDVIITERPDA